MTSTKMVSAFVVGAFVAGVGLVAVGAGMGSEFIRGLGAFPLFLVMFLLPNALLEWEAPQVGRLGTPPADDIAYLNPSTTATDAAEAR
jgi:hypothetical protein